MSRYPSAPANDIERPHMTGEQRLYVAIIEQALMDIKKINDPVTSDSAWSFLTDRSGAWAQSRSCICSAIGVHPGRLRQDVLQTRDAPSKLREDRRSKRRTRGTTVS